MAASRTLVCKRTWIWLSLLVVGRAILCILCIVLVATFLIAYSNVHGTANQGQSYTSSCSRCSEQPAIVALHDCQLLLFRQILPTSTACTALPPRVRLKWIGLKVLVGDTSAFTASKQRGEPFERLTRNKSLLAINRPGMLRDDQNLSRLLLLSNVL